MYLYDESDTTYKDKICKDHGLAKINETLERQPENATHYWKVLINRYSRKWMMLKTNTLSEVSTNQAVKQKNVRNKTNYCNGMILIFALNFLKQMYCRWKIIRVPITLLHFKATLVAKSYMKKEMKPNCLRTGINSSFVQLQYRMYVHSLDLQRVEKSAHKMHPDQNEVFNQIATFLKFKRGKDLKNITVHMICLEKLLQQN